MSKATRTHSLRAATLEFLYERFPACFDADDPRPLKLGIASDLAAALPPEVTAKALNLALEGYTKDPRYLTRVAAEAPRMASLASLPARLGLMKPRMPHGGWPASRTMAACPSRLPRRRSRRRHRLRQPRSVMDSLDCGLLPGNVRIGRSARSTSPSQSAVADLSGGSHPSDS